jgi:hypothetical protein
MNEDETRQWMTDQLETDDSRFKDGYDELCPNLLAKAAFESHNGNLDGNDFRQMFNIAREVIFEWKC